MPDLSAPILLVSLLAFLCSSAGCFIAGVVCAPTFRDWQIRRAGKHFKSLYAILLGELEHSERVAQLASAAIPDVVGQREQHRFSTVRGRLTDLLQQVGVMSGCVLEMERAAAKPAVIEWQITTKDPLSGLPDRAAFEHNLGMVHQESKRSGVVSGLLVFRIDKAEQLIQRLGATTCEAMRQKMSSVAIRSLREVDLLVRLDDDSFGIIFPGTTADEGERFAQNVRSAIRRHRFRTDDTGTEILVTASFGYATCWPDEHPKQAMDRALMAVDRSIRSGRNQLHVFDTDRAVLCPVDEGNVLARAK